MATRKKLIIKTKQALAMILYMVLGVDIMSELMKLIKQKKESYKSLKVDIRHDMNTAKRLGFETEADKLNKDRGWVAEILELLEELAIV